MDSLWPWLAVAGAGAWHGLNPATGWGLAAACGWRARSPRQALSALVPLTAGHAASVAVVAALAAQGQRLQAEPLAVLGAVVLGALLWRHRGASRGAPSTTRLAVAAWSFCMASLHGVGLMLVPALVPICLSSVPAREITASGSWVLALTALAVHLAAMLTVTAVMACGACIGILRGGPQRG